MRFLYFAYGMNTNSTAMFESCSRLGRARLLNYSWEMLQFANVYPTEKSTYGVLWDIDQGTLDYLDRREGYPYFYDRVVTDVEHDGEIKKAIVYTLTDKSRVSYSNFEASQSYIDMVTEGLLEDGMRIGANKIELI